MTRGRFDGRIQREGCRGACVCFLTAMKDYALEYMKANYASINL